MLHICKSHSEELEKFQKNHPQHYARLQFCSLALSGCNINSLTLKSVSLLSVHWLQGPKELRRVSKGLRSTGAGARGLAIPSQVTLPAAALHVLKPRSPVPPNPPTPQRHMLQQRPGATLPAQSFQIQLVMMPEEQLQGGWGSLPLPISQR